MRFNTTLSQNKIVEFSEFIDDWDSGIQVEESHKNTDIAFSPSVIGGGQLIFSPLNSNDKGKLDLALVSKYVGEQYLDNTSSEFGKLDDYFVHDLRINYTLKTKLFKEVVISSWVRNLLNQNYISTAWIYRFQSLGYNPIDDDPSTNLENSETGRYNMIGAYNQAGINFFVGLKLRF